MNTRAIWMLVISAAGLGCARDSSITRGADGTPEWDRRLSASISAGMTVDVARATMQRNGFRCHTSASNLWCEKESGGRFAIVRRRWLASLAFQDGQVRAIKGTTGLVGP